MLRIDAVLLLDNSIFEVGPVITFPGLCKSLLFGPHVIKMFDGWVPICRRNHFELSILLAHNGVFDGHVKL